jgi:hypothetical protein
VTHIRPELAPAPTEDRLADPAATGYESPQAKRERGQAMNEAEKDLKQRNRTIAENESERQTISAIRVSTWAIAVAVVLGLIVFGWVKLH